MKTYTVHLMGVFPKTTYGNLPVLVVSAKTYKRALALARKEYPHLHSSRFRLERD